ncbi:hypothetical protein AAKU52_002668 [Pedobacter sp. CG_S7]|uniref:hypothetical protein n=1 Tax=Pedobacter sp. CG_S7 TaxID=3143930 RepID=UPI00339591C7
MNIKVRTIFDQFLVKGLRPLSIGLLIIICLLSSCSVRKGFQSFLSGESFEYFASGKLVKPIIAKATVDDAFKSCNTLNQGMEKIQSLTHAESSKIAMVPLLFFLLPGFLISLRVTIKDHAVLPVPYSLLQWSYLPLFLQNRFLLL